MDTETILGQFYQRGVHEAALFLIIFIALIVLLTVSRLLKGVPRLPLEHTKPTHSSQGNPPHSFLTRLKHGLSLQRLRDSATTSNVLQLSLWGWKASHNVVYTPRQIRIFAHLRSSTVDYVYIKWRIFNSVFGVPSKYHEAYLQASEELDACVVKFLMQEPWMGEMVRTTIANTERNIGTLVTFTEADARVKLAAWEQHAFPRVVAGSKGGSASCEVSLYPLLTKFLGSMAMPAMMGKAIVAQAPNTLEEIDALDDSFALLALGLPRWLPVPSLRRAYHARDRLHRSLERLYTSLDKVAEELDPGPPWRDLGDVSHLIKEFDGLWKKAGFSVHARAAAALSMPWALTINGNNVLFWLVLRIHATPGLADTIRGQTKAFFAQPSHFTKTPQLEECPSADDPGRWCPLLKACYLETIRLDGEIRSIRKIRGDQLITANEDGDAAASSVHKLCSGDYIHALHYLHHSDPKYFPDPQAFKPERFLIPGNETKLDQRTLRPYGAGFSMCKGRVIAERVILYTVASFLHTWRMKPGNGAKEWKIPDHVSAAGVCKPRQDVRVLMSRRS